MRKLAALAGVAALGLAGQANAAIYTGNLTLTIGDSGDGSPVGTGPQIPVGTFITADGTWALGNIDSLGDKTWSAQSPNSLSSVTPVDNRFYTLTGSNGTSYYNPYDQVADGTVDYSADGESPNCTTSALVFAYACSKLEGKTLKIRPTPITATGPLPTATGAVTIDTTAGTLTGVLTLNAGPFGSPYAYDYRSADGSPFNASQNSFSDAGQITLNLTGTFTGTSWNITGGTGIMNDPGYTCQAGDLSGTLCTNSAVLGGHQSNGGHASWINVPVYDKVESDVTRALLATIPGVVLTASLDGSGNITSSSGEFHRGLGSASAGCQQDIVYGGGKLTCGNLTAGKLLASGTFTEQVQVVPVPAAVWLFGSAIGLMGALRRRLG